MIYRYIHIHTHTYTYIHIHTNIVRYRGHPFTMFNIWFLLPISPKQNACLYWEIIKASCLSDSCSVLRVVIIPTIKLYWLFEIIKCVACRNASEMVVFGKLSGIVPIKSMLIVPVVFVPYIMIWVLFEVMKCVACRNAVNILVSGLLSGISPALTHF